MPETKRTKMLPSRRKLALLFATLILIGAAGLAWNKMLSTPPAHEPIAQESLDQDRAEPSPIDADARYRTMIVGSWEDEYQGKRTMTLDADGTGTMIVELGGWRAAFSASRLKFNMTWSIEAGRLKKQTIGGEPESQIKMILNTLGDRVDESILELTPNRLLLLDGDGKTQYDWRRVKEK